MSVALGGLGKNKTLRLTDEERSRHVHVIGASGTGKSKMLESMIRQDITAGRGLCLIDPHGTLADAVLQWCAATGMQDFRRIHVVEPSELGWCAGFNPLRTDGLTETAVRVDAMVAACAQVWGGENANATPLLKKCLRAVFYALTVRGLTLAEAPLLTNSSSLARRRLIADLPDPIFDAVWRDFEALPQRMFFEQFSSTNNRLLEFLSSPIVRRIVGQKDGALDLKAVMDGNEIVIVNLASKGALSADNARLLGTLLTSELFLQALERDPAAAKAHPFTLYVDECYDFLTSDIERMLDQTRKFGLHLVLSHQRLGQLRERSEGIYNGVMTGGQTKVVFGGLTDDDAEVMAREIMRSTFDLERPKHVLDKPVVVGEEAVWLGAESWTNSSTVGVSTGGNSGSGAGFGSSQTLTESYAAPGFLSRGALTGTTEVMGTSANQSEFSGSSWSETASRGEARTTGRAQTLQSIRQVMPTAVYSLEELQHQAILKLRELPNRAAIVRRRGKPPVQIRTAEIRPALASPERVQAFLQTARVKSPYVIEAGQADAEVASRSGGSLPPKTARSDEDEFWSEAPA